MHKDMSQLNSERRAPKIPDSEGFDGAKLPDTLYPRTVNNVVGGPLGTKGRKQRKGPREATEVQRQGDVHKTSKL